MYFLLLFLINPNIYSQTFDETVLLADKMLKNNDFKKAIELYKRISFFSEEKDFITFKKIANCYYNLTNYKLANSYLDSALLYCNTKNELININFLKIDCFIFLEEYYQAKHIISSLKIDSTNILFQKASFYLGIINFAETDYINAEKHFLKSINDTSIIKKEKIRLAFKNKNKLKRPNPKIARTLSLIIPGGGQLYAGDYKNAANSFLLVAVFAAIGADMYFSYAWYDSLISVFPWFYRYYNGGSKNAMQIAKQKRTLKQNNKLNEVFIILQKP